MFLLAIKTKTFRKHPQSQRQWKTRPCKLCKYLILNFGLFLEECLVDNHPTNNKCSLPLEDGHLTDIWNKLSILEAALIRKYDPLADSQSNIIPKPTTGIGIPLSILTDCCCFYSTRFTDLSFCVDSFHEFQADVGQAGNSSFLNASCWWDGFQNVFLSGSGMCKLKGRPL